MAVSPLLILLLLAAMTLGPVAGSALAAWLPRLAERINVEQSIPSALNYASYLGGSGDDWAFNGAADPTGAFYIVGRTDSADFPGGAATGGKADVVVAKIAPDGTRLWTSIFGGNDDDVPYAVWYDPTGHVVVAGSTKSQNFPVSPGAAQPTYGGGPDDGFVAKLKASDGVVVWSTFVGGPGSEQVNGIAAGSDGSVFIHGHTGSANLPTPGGFQSTYGGGPSDSFVARYSPDGALNWRSFLGGNDEELSAGLALDAAGAVYVTGRTRSSNFPVKNAFQSAFGGDADGFVVKISPAGNEVVWSTFLGGASSDLSRAIAVDDAGRVAVAGWTRSGNFPVKNAVQSMMADPVVGNVAPFFDGFIALIAADGASLLWSTYFGGLGHDRFRGIAISADGVSVVGYTESPTYRTLNPVQASAAGVGHNLHDIVVTQIGLDGQLKFSSYLGGRGNDQAYGIADLGGKLAIAGGTTSTDFPTAQPKQAANAGGEDIVIAILSPGRIVLDRASFIPISAINFAR
jgi:hypothetical protein